MAGLVAVFGVLVAGIGVVGVVSPERLVQLLVGMDPRVRLRVAVGVRVVLGIALWLAAPDSRFPDLLRVLAIIALVAAAGLVPMGAERLDAFVRWWSERAGGLLRAWAVVAVAFGALLVYAVY